MALYVWGSDSSGELGNYFLNYEINKYFQNHKTTGLGGAGLEEDELIYCPQKMQWEELGNLKQAALGGQVGTS
jgi:hypothetical protein